MVNTEREDFEPTLTLIIKFWCHDSVAWVWNSTECNTGDRLMASNKQSVKGRAYMLVQKKKF